MLDILQVDQDFYHGKPQISNVGRIVTHRHWKDVNDLLVKTKGKVLCGGGSHEETLFIEPTVLDDVLENDPMLAVEIFAPIFPVVKYKDTADAKRLLRKISPCPLARYIFTEDMDEAEDFVNFMEAGSVAINDCMAQIAPTSLPFGGVGQSGFGAYHGLASIDGFSYLQSMVTVPTSQEFENMLEWRYPYSESPGMVDFVKANLEFPLP